MNYKILKIVSVSSEVSPFSKSGGLGDVARSLPKAIKRLGHDIIVVTPFYSQLINPKKYKLKLVFKDINLTFSYNDLLVNYWQGYLMDDLPVYFIENKKYFSKEKNLYGSNHDNLKFLIFDLAVLKLLSLLKFKADIIHCHDWHTGLIPYYLKNDFKNSDTLANTKTIYTIHNLAFQLGKNWWEVPLKMKDNGRKSLPEIYNPEIEYINFAKRGILYADIINTVSEQYRDEILTKNFGQDLHRILINRQEKLYGIVNGIDYNTYNPNNDTGLYKNFDFKNYTKKKFNKLFLQKKFGLEKNDKIPLICSTSRVTFQKGFGLILKIAESLMDLNVQIIIIGGGDKKYIKQLQKIAYKYHKNFKLIPSHEENQKYETLIYAGSDFFLLPSNHEPCGINQLIAMRYGCIPIVRKVGGLNDTVENIEILNSRKLKGTGFVFKKFDELSLYGTIVKALEYYKQKVLWKKIIVRAMKKSSSWEIPAKKYINLYKKSIIN